MARTIILINPAPLHGRALQGVLRDRYPYPPVGLLSLAGQLMMHGWSVTLLDLHREGVESRAAFLARLSAAGNAPLLVGLATYTETYLDTLALARAVREVFPRTFIVVGGPHATFRAAETLGDCPAIDAVARFEAEASLVELVEHLSGPGGLDLWDIPGLTFRNADGDVHHVPANGLVTHLDCLPLPPYHLVSRIAPATDDSVLAIMTSRGCPGHCVFCASHALSGAAERVHSPERLAGFIYDHLGEQGHRPIGVMDDTFLVDLPRLRRFAGYLKELGYSGAWRCKSRVDSVDDERLAILRGAGCCSVHIGVESGDDAVLKGVAKGITVRQVLDTIVSMAHHGIRAECSFMVGHHCDTAETMEKTLMLAAAICDSGAGTAAVSIATPLPGTPLLERARAMGVRMLARDWRNFDFNTPLFETDGFTAGDVKKAQFAFEGRRAGGPMARVLYHGDMESHEALLREFVRRIDASRTERNDDVRDESRH